VRWEHGGYNGRHQYIRITANVAGPGVTMKIIAVREEVRKAELQHVQRRTLEPRMPVHGKKEE